MATAQSRDTAAKLLKGLQDEFFIGYRDAEKRQDQTKMEHLLAMQDRTYNITSVGGRGGVLEIGKRK